MNFPDACAALRPELHRFCTRMTRSPCDGEDVVHEVLATAIARREELREGASLRSWLFRIAQTKCIDLIRARKPTSELEDEAAEENMGKDLDEKRRVERALTNMVTELPAKERAAVVLKDVLDCSLEETAEITQSNVGAVKAALHRAREKLREAETRADVRREPLAPAKREVIANYLEAFNRRDWDAVRAIVSDDARLEVIDRTEAQFRTSRYLSNYAALATQWLLELAFVDGEEQVVHYRKVDDTWQPQSIVRVEVANGRISHVRDYLHVDYLLRFCDVARAGPDRSGGGAEGGDGSTDERSRGADVLVEGAPE